MLLCKLQVCLGFVLIYVSSLFRPADIVLCLISTVKRDCGQLDQMGVQVGLEGAFLVEGSDFRSVYRPQMRQLPQLAAHSPHHLQSTFTTPYLFNIMSHILLCSSNGS